MHTSSGSARRPARPVVHRLTRRGRGPAWPATGRRARSRATTMVIFGAALSAAAAGCSGGDLAQPAQPAYHGPVVTIRVAMYGQPGYQRGGVYTAFERLHPGIHVVEDTTAAEGAYWQSTRRQLASGQEPGDLIAIPIGEMAGTVARDARQLVPLNSLGGATGSVSQFEDQWLPWIWKPASNAGRDYAVGAETGPLAMCYRPMLLRQAGLASAPAALARAWSTWSGYLAYGRTFKQRIPHGPAFMDSVTSVYKAMISQAPQQYYSAGGKLVAAHSPAVKNAWNTAVQATRDQLAGRFPALTPAWDTAVTRVSFATGVCAPWMLNTIEKLSGTGGSGTWAVAGVPGGTGNWDGFYLAIPRSSTHQQAAYQLAMYLTGQQAGVPLARAGGFPASSPAINAVAGVTSPYFTGSPIGKIFGIAADRMPQAPGGPAVDAVAADFAAGIARVEGGVSPATAWAHAQHRAAAAARASHTSG